uniref:hypothetical protein n=1 Tax=Enterocloster aldenensis TaxID=358742 RepID=UPI0022E4C1BB
MIVSTFYDKLNKVDGNIYVVEEETHLTNGVYEAELQHDNINEATFAVFTGPKLTGERLETYTLSTPSLAPWKRIVRVYADAPVVYISYETDGDTVEGDDINRVQESIVATQEALNTEEGRALGEEKKLTDDLQAETNRAIQEEDRLDGRVDTEAERAKEAEQVNSVAIKAESDRAKAAEKANADTINTESNRAQAAERVLQENIDGHTDAVNLEIQSLRAADTVLEEKKANADDVNRELGNRYTKDQVYTKVEVLKKIEDLIGAAPDTLDTFREIADALGNDPNFATTIMTALGGKVDKIAGKQLSSNDYTDEERAELADVSNKKHTHGNKSVLDKLTEILLNNWTDAYNKRHEHSNKTVIDKLTQAMLDKLAGIASGAEVNVQPDWNVTDTGSDAYIRNKPSSMPASDVPAWAKASAKPTYAWTEIGSKPSTFPPAVHSHTKNQISDMPTKLSQFTNDSGYLTAADVDTSQNHTHANKTVLDKITQAMLDKLAGIAEGANKYVHPTTAGNKHVPSGGSSGQILRWSADGTAAWGADDNTTYAVFKAATSSAAGGTGLVPAPAAGAQTKYLRADGTWQTPPDTKYSHPSSGVTAGTYRSVTVNAQGHVTAGSNPALTWNDLKGV